MSKTYRIITIAAIILVAMSAAAWAQAADKDTAKAPAKEETSTQAVARTAADLRAISDTDFTFVLFRDELLYPETSIAFNPAVAAGFKGSLLSGALDLPYMRTDDTLIRADESVGQKGGTSRTVVDTITPDLSVMSLFPAGPSSLSLVGGVYGQARLDFDRSQTKNDNYDSISESKVDTKLQWPVSATIGGLVAGGPRNSGWGATAQYAYTMSLHAIEEIDSVAGGQTVTTFGDVLNAADAYTHDLDIRLGKRFPLSRSTSLGLALAVGAGLRDASAAYKAVDTNNDGAYDRVLSLHDYYFSPDFQSTVAYSYDRKDLTWGFRALLSPDLRISLQDGLEVFLDGTWRGLDMQYRNYYEHVLYDAASTDKSVLNSLLDTSLRSGEVMLGMSFGTSTDSLWKVGVGYRRTDNEYSETGVDVLGNSVFSTVNPNNYPEYNLGTAPQNDLVSGMVGAQGLPPWSDVTNGVLLTAGFEYKAAAKLRLFASLGAEWFNQVQTWNVFNLDTRTVWTESVTVNELSWDARAVAGIAFELDKDTVFTLDCVGTGVSGVFTGSSETLPFDLGAGTDTTNGTTDTTSGSPLTLKIHAGLTYRY
jgi:hypothetical protein